jgi:hypothetical protein
MFIMYVVLVNLRDKWEYERYSNKYLWRIVDLNIYSLYVSH